MKSLRLFALVAFFASVAWAQDPLPAVSPQTAASITAWPIYTLNIAPVKGANKQVIGVAGQTTYYYWAVANFPIGSVLSPLGKITTAPNTLSSGNYVQISPFGYPAGVTSVDFLRTTIDQAPTGACNCAIATGVTSGTVNDQSNSLSSYTVPVFNPLTYVFTLTDEVQSGGGTHFILRQGWPWPGTEIVDLSAIATAGCGSGTAGNLLEFTGSGASSTCGNAPIVDSSGLLFFQEPGRWIAPFNTVPNLLEVFSAPASGCGSGGQPSTFADDSVICSSIWASMNPTVYNGDIQTGLYGAQGVTVAPLSSHPALVTGVYGISDYDAAATIAQTWVAGTVGVGYAQGVGGAGTIANLAGAVGLAQWNTGGPSITSMYGVYGQVQSNVNTGTNTAPFGAALYAASPRLSATATLTSSYGLYIADQTTGASGGTVTNPFGVYQAGLGSNEFGGGIGQTAANRWAGKCTMATTTCTITLAYTFTTPICTATLQGTGTVIAGECSVSGTTVTITAASSNTGTWAAMVFGDPI